jgi:peroxiredoxin
MKKYFLLIVLSVISLIAISQVSIKLKIQNNKYKQAYLCSVYGSEITALSETNFINETISFVLNPEFKGVYKIIFNDNSQIDIIIDNDKEIELNTKYPEISQKITVIKGEENKKYYSFINYRIKQVNDLNMLISKINSNIIGNQISEKIGFFKGVYTYKIQRFADSLISIDTSLFVSKLIKAMLIPDLNLYTLKNPEAIKYKNDVEFLMLHFFDNIDFNNTELINTDIVYKTIKAYIGKIVLPRNVIGFNYANEFIINKTNDIKFKNYIISELLKIYENTQLEEVYLKLFTDYIEKNPKIISDKQYIEVVRKINIIKRLKQNSKIQDFNVIDVIGKEKNITSLNLNFNILVFYKSDTKNIKSTIKQLNYIYTKYANKGVNIIAISLDENQDIWKKFISENNFNYNNYIIKKEHIKIITDSFNTWALPSIYIINKKNILEANPMNVDYVKNECEKVFK